MALKTCEAAFGHDMRCHAHGHVFAVNVEDLSRKTYCFKRETYRQERNKKNVLSFKLRRKLLLSEALEEKIFVSSSVSPRMAELRLNHSPQSNCLGWGADHFGVRSSRPPSLGVLLLF